jgi:hypothetical protein
MKNAVPLIVAWMPTAPQIPTHTWSPSAVRCFCAADSVRATHAGLAVGSIVVIGEPARTPTSAVLAPPRCEVPSASSVRDRIREALRTNAVRHDFGGDRAAAADAHTAVVGSGAPLTVASRSSPPNPRVALPALALVIAPAMRNCVHGRHITNNEHSQPQETLGALYDRDDVQTRWSRWVAALNWRATWCSHPTGRLPRSSRSTAIWPGLPRGILGRFAAHPCEHPGASSALPVGGRRR